MSRARWAPWAVAVLAALLLAVLPFLSLIDDLPWGADSVKWLDRGSLDHPRWAHWVFSERHFIGYRPVAAFSFLLNHATTGYAAWGYRGTDLALHAASALALFALVRGLLRDRGVWAVVAMVVYAGHPAVEEVVPFVARRSYLLAQAFGWAALALAVHAAPADGRRRALAAVATAASMGLALLSNEGAYVLLPLLPLCVLHADDGRPLREALGRLPVAVLPTVGVALLALARRHQILGSLSGGYHKRYFAYLHRTVPAWQELDAPDPLAVADAVWRYTLLPHPVMGGATPFDALRPLALGAGLLLIAVAAARPLVDRRPDARLGALAALWLAGATALVVASDTWFWRQAAFLLPAVGLLATAWLREGVQAVRARRARDAWPLLPAVALLLPPLLAGPLMGGMHTEAHTVRQRYSPLAQQLIDLGPQLPDDAVVHLVVPAPTGAAHMIRLWGDRAARAHHLEHRLLAELAPKADPDRAAPTILTPRRAPRLVLDDTMVWSHEEAHGVRLTGTRLPLARLAGAGRPRWVVLLGPEPMVLPLGDADTP